MRLIDADALIERNKALADCEFIHAKYQATLREVVDDEPTVDAEEVKHGHWIGILSINNTYKCSVCGRLLVNITDGKKNVAKHYPYCHCGAKMDEVTE